MVSPESTLSWVDDVGVVLGPTISQIPLPVSTEASAETATYRIRRRGTEIDEDFTERNSILITLARYLGSDSHYSVDASWVLYDGQQARIHKENVFYQISPDGEYIDFFRPEDPTDDPVVTIYAVGTVFGVIDEKVIQPEFLRVQADQESKSA